MIGGRPLSTIEEVDSDPQWSPLGTGMGARTTAEASGNASGHQRDR